MKGILINVKQFAELELAGENSNKGEVTPMFN
jgi:hypothetical protein